MRLVIFDLETTGLDRTKDQIIQFAAVKIDVDTDEVIDEFNTYVKPIGNYSISIGAYLKHKITPKLLEDKPTFSQIAPKIIEFFNGEENILTYNGNSFDIAFLKSELNRYGFDIDFTQKKCYDAFVEERRRNGNKLDDTFKRYTGKSMEESGLTAHDAFSDIKGTYAIFVAQQKSKEYGPEHMYGEDSVIIDMEFEGETKPCFNIGKYKGVSIEYVASIDKNYIRWCVSDKCNFMESTKKYIQQYI